MVKQQRRSEMSAEQQKRLDVVKAKLTQHVSCDHVNERQRRGIIKLTDRFGRRRSFYDHQLIAAQRLWLKDKSTPLEQGRKAGMACLHDMGLGKTITAILMIAGIHMLVRDVADELSIVVCPLSVLRVWFDTFKSWTTFDDRIVMAEHQSKITSSVMKHARVIITTPDVLIQAFKTFMWKNPKAESWTTKAGKVKYRWGFCHGIDPKDKKRKARFGDKLPPIHPLFKHAMNRHDAGKHAFTTAIIDEVHKCSNPRTWSGHIISKLCKEAVYTVGLTGTPVRARPKQVAWIVKALDVRPEWLQEAKYYTVHGGGEHCVRRSTVTAFHNDVVDRVDESVVDLQPIKKITLAYDPFIGRKRDGSYDAEQQKRHDSWLLRAQEAAAQATEADAYRKHLDEWLWQAFTTMGQFTFDPTLGMYGAEAFQKEPQIYYKLAKRQPSQTVHLIWRMLRDRQSKGHPRIVVYSESTVMLTIARNYVAKAGHCGALFLFTGSLSSQQRDTMIKNFLSEDNPKGVLFMSGAGAIGTNLCPGCDTMFVVGDVPWNNSELAQAHGRVHRITQDRPVEIVQFEPRRSVTSAKLVAHEDKRDRLEPAMKDEDFSNFSMDADEKWRLRAEMTMSLTTLDKTGNYKMTKEMEELEEEWKQACEQADAAGNPHPPKPAICHMPDAELADDIALPPVSYPVEGFVEPPSDVDDDDDDDDVPRVPKRTLVPGDRELPVELDAEEAEAALDEMLAMSKSSGKRAKPMVEASDEAKNAMAKRMASLQRLASVRKEKKRDTTDTPAWSDDESESEQSWIVSDEEEEEEEDNEWASDNEEDDEDDDADDADAGVPGDESDGK